MLILCDSCILLHVGDHQREGEGGWKTGDDEA